ncbi:hypothetical protein [Streptomyces prunicolor]|uniref:hypothetical protein n=1 Tax=Streptomyces prunicolor TaxID=67348 RepID=UPI00342A2D7A
MATASRQAYAALWHFLAGIDLVSWIEREGAVDESLAHLLTDPRAARSTPVARLWVRLIDVDRALAARRYGVTRAHWISSSRSTMPSAPGTRAVTGWRPTRTPPLAYGPALRPTCG